MKLSIPARSLVILIGASGSGKSSFAQKHFKATEILSSDRFRAMVRDDESDQSASKDAFDVLHYVLKKRLAAGRLTVIDATNVRGKDRRSLLKLGEAYGFYAIAIALNLPEHVCQQRNQQRPNRQVPAEVVIDQVRSLGRSLTTLDPQKFHQIHIFTTPQEVEFVVIERHKTEPKQLQQNNGLNITDLLGKKVLSTRLYKKITLRPENTAAALEVMSRFAINPKWLIYLPPTVVPPAASALPNFLEHPAAAFDYYQQQGVETLMCQEKHTGTRAVVILCCDESVTQRRFGISAGIGTCYTRTGRRFFDNAALEKDFLTTLNNALSRANFWESFSTDWVCFEGELMPWSAKAKGHLKHRYAAVGAAATHGLNAAVDYLERASRRIDAADVLFQYQQKKDLAQRYVSNYRQHCWPVNDLLDLKLAPFHILATEGSVHTDKTHEWHQQKIAKWTQFAPDLLYPTRYRTLKVNDERSHAESIRWWEDLTAAGSEGIVVKPMDFIHDGTKGFAQPAMKCRGVEALRMVYGPEYSLPENLRRLKKRGVGRKRAIATREFALGIESLERFVAKAPLNKVHECVFGILALESESVDPRL